MPHRGGAQPQRGHAPNRPGIRHGVRPPPVRPPVPPPNPGGTHGAAPGSRRASPNTPPNPGGLGPGGGGVPPPGGTPPVWVPEQEPHHLDHQVAWEIIHQIPLEQAEIQVAEEVVEVEAVEAAAVVAAVAVEQPCHITTDNQEGEDKHNLNPQPQIRYKEQILQW